MHGTLLEDITLQASGKWVETMDALLEDITMDALLEDITLQASGKWVETMDALLEAGGKWVETSEKSVW